MRPIPFPNRKLPEKPKPSDKLRVKLVDDARDFEVMWQHIKRVELFEYIVLEEARQLTAAGKIDEAFDYYSFLVEQYPKMDGLAEARQMYLYQSAVAAFGQKKFAEALGILEELRRLNPDFRASDASPTVNRSLGSMADNLIASYVAKNDYRSARILLERLVKSYQAGDEPFASKWVSQLADMIPSSNSRTPISASIRFHTVHASSSAMAGSKLLVFTAM